jgi:menaquinol-cytochrome c reductase iron-sulfur subunit
MALMRSPDMNSQSDRRGFLRSSLALVLGGIAAVVPVAAGFRVLCDPLRRRGAGSKVVKVTTIEALPDDGLPRRFPIIATRKDAWNRFNDVRIGAVFLRRTPDGKVAALNVTCPHAGCFVDFSPERGQFRCPCHESSFALDGAIASPRSPSPRGLDPLAVRVDEEGGVWVTYLNFQAGRPDRVTAA